MGLIRKMKKIIFKKDFIGVILNASSILFLIVLVLYFVVLFNLLQINIELLNASIVLVLLFVTYLYTNHTAQIVEETRNDRKIAYIEKRLEKLYYPIKLFLKPSMEIPRFPPILIKNQSDFVQSSPFYRIVKIENIIPFLYLASDNLKEYSDKYIEMFRDGELRNSKEMQVLKNEIIEIVEQDIASLQKELAKLIE